MHVGRRRRRRRRRRESDICTRMKIGETDRQTAIRINGMGWDGIDR